MEVFWNYPQWEYIDPIPDQGFYRIRKNGSWGILDKNQQIVIPCRWEYIGPFRDRLIFVKEGGRWGILRMDGTLAVACEWSCVTDVPGDPGRFILSRKDTSGNVITRKINLRTL